MPLCLGACTDQKRTGHEILGSFSQQLTAQNGCWEPKPGSLELLLNTEPSLLPMASVLRGQKSLLSIICEAIKVVVVLFSEFTVL